MYIYIYIYMCVCVCVCVHSSPYLYVCGDDRVTFIREQMMFQVSKEMPKSGEWEQRLWDCL